MKEIAENPGKINQIMPAFLFQDLSVYNYDMTQPMFKDICKIAENASFSYYLYPYRAMERQDYQEGRLNLEEVIDQIQRNTEMWRNE